MIKHGDKIKLTGPEIDCLSLAAGQSCNPTTISDLNAWQKEIAAQVEDDTPEGKLLTAMALSLHENP